MELKFIRFTLFVFMKYVQWSNAETIVLYHRDMDQLYDRIVHDTEAHSSLPELTKEEKKAMCLKTVRMKAFYSLPLGKKHFESTLFVIREADIVKYLDNEQDQRLRTKIRHTSTDKKIRMFYCLKSVKESLLIEDVGLTNMDELSQYFVLYNRWYEKDVDKTSAGIEEEHNLTRYDIAGGFEEIESKVIGKDAYKWKAEHFGFVDTTALTPSVHINTQESIFEMVKANLSRSQTTSHYLKKAGRISEIVDLCQASGIQRFILCSVIHPVRVTPLDSRLIKNHDKLNYVRKYGDSDCLEGDLLYDRLSVGAEPPDMIYNVIPCHVNTRSISKPPFYVVADQNSQMHVFVLTSRFVRRNDGTPLFHIQQRVKIPGSYFNLNL